MSYVIEGRSIQEKSVKIDTEVCIIGSGAGGAVTAHYLAEAGYKVTVLEAGGFFPPGSLNGKSEFDAMATTYFGGALQTTKKQDVTMIQGRAIGGSTLVNHALCFRIPEYVSNKWTKKGAEGKTLADLNPHYDRIEKIIDPKPTIPEAMNENNNIIYRNFQKRGWNVEYTQRNTSHCIGCGSCIQTCPIGAKNSMDRTFLPMAHENGAGIYSDFAVQKLDLKNGRAHRAIGHILDEFRHKKGDFEVTADIFIVAGGAVQTPVILQRSGFSDSAGQLGKNFIIHPLLLIQAQYERRLESYRGVPQSVFSRQFSNYSQGNEEGHLLFYGDFEGYMVTSMYLTGFGKEYSEHLKYLPNTSQAQILVNDTGTGHVDSNDDDYNFHYEVTEKDRETLARGCRIMGEIYFEEGAIRVMVGDTVYRNMNELSKINADSLAPFKAGIAAAHPQCSARMGSPETGVVDSYGKVWDLENVYIADASIFPASSGVNPQLTVMALASQVADNIIRKAKG